MNTIQEPTRRPRLNPFVFPSDTDLRFILLILCVLGATLWIYNSSLLYKNRDIVDHLVAEFQCSARNSLVTAMNEVVLHPQSWNNFDVAWSLYHKCMIPFYFQDFMRMGVGLFLLFIVTGLIYLFLPFWIRRRKRLIPLPLAQMPELAVELSELCREAGLTRQPQFVWNPLNPSSEGFAFGHLGRYWVAIGGGLIKQFYTDRSAFRSVLRHELAHLSNADINKTYLSIAIWWAFVVIALVPVAYYQAINTTSSTFIANLLFDVNLIGHVVALTVLVFLTRNAVLRSRELYADVRASVVDGPAGGLHQLLERAAQGELRVRWIALLVHPDVKMRYAVVNDTRLLFRSSFWISFNTGIAATVAFDGIFALFTPLSGFLQVATLALIGAGLLLGGLTIGIIGSTLWRAIFAALVEGKKQYGIGRIACGFVLGSVLGIALSFSSIAGSNLLSFNTLGILLLTWILLSLLLLGSVWLVLRWVAMVATIWLPLTTHPSILRWSSRFTLLVAGIVWAVFFGTLVYLGEDVLIQSDIVFFLLVFALMLFLAQSFVVIGLICVWIVPLIASFWYKRAVGANGVNWAFFDTPAPSLPLAPENPFRLRFPLILGIIVALLFCSIDLILNVYLHVSLSEASRSTILFKFSRFYGLVGLSALLQASVATIVVLRVRYLRISHALYAAFVGGTIMAIGVLSINLLFGGKADGLFIWQVFSTIINYGTILALLTAFCVLVLIRWVSKAQARPGVFSARFALVAGLLSTLAFCEILFVTFEAIVQLISAIKTLGMKGELTTLQAGLQPLLYILMMIAILFEVTTGILVTTRVSRLPVLQGFLAALLSAIGMFVGMIVAFLWQGKGWVLTFGMFIFWIFIVEGLSLSLLVILFISILMRKRQQEHLSLIRLALRNGLIGGLPVCIFILVITIVVSLLPKELQADMDLRGLLYFGQSALAVLFQGGVAAVVACRVRRLPFVSALLAAVICGCVISIGIVTSLFLIKGDMSPKALLAILVVSVTDFVIVIVLGVVLSLLVALVFSLLARLVRRAHRSTIERVKTAPLTDL